MKKTISILIIAVAMVFSSQNSIAQTKGKVGHINMNDLLLMLPDRDTAEQALSSFAKELEGQLTTMSLEYEKLVADYQTNLATMTDPVKELKAIEIGDLEKRIRDFQTKAQESLAVKEQSLMEPLLQKAKEAVQSVAKEQGYSYVIDNSAQILVAFPETDDLLPKVKSKLGL